MLLPLATLVAAGAVAIGSGATFTSESGSTITAASGTLGHINSATGDVALAITKLKPGASATGTVTITNDGTLNSDLTVIASGASGELAPALELEITGDSGSTGFDGEFEAVDAGTGTWELGTLTAGGTTPDSITVTVKVTMKDRDPAIDNEFKGTSADLSLKFVTTQTDEDETVVDGWNMPTP